MSKKAIWYTIYKGDQFIFVGTRQECATKLSVSENTIQFMASPTHHKRDTGDRLIAVKIDEKD